MNKQIDYYCTSISPFTYLGQTRLLELVEECNADITYKPVIISKIFAESGALPVHQRPESRQKYRLLEIKRWARKRNLPVNLQPQYFPADPSLADKCVIALQMNEQDPGVFLNRVLAACWAEHMNVAEADTLQNILSSLGLDSQQILQQAASAEVQNIYEANTQQAIEQGVLGVPSYMVDGEQFWGQDRLELLADSLLIDKLIEQHAL